MVRRRVVALVGGGLLALAAALAVSGAVVASGAYQPDTNPVSASASGAPGNNGTAKIHSANTETEPIVNEEPKVCTFHVHFFFADSGQSGSWWIQSWPPTGNGTTVLSGIYLTDASGEYRTPASPNTYSLPNGHYKLFWQGSTDQTSKHKTFWVYCAPASPSPTPYQSFRGSTATPSVTATPSCQGIKLDVYNPPSPTASTTATATRTPCPTPTATPTEASSATPTDTPTEPPSESPTEAPSATPTEVSTETPFQSFQGETATPVGTPSCVQIDAAEQPTPCSTPFQSFQGDTATPGTTPPPTTTGDGSGGSSSPLSAILISLVFGALGLTAVQAQRRSIRR